jgi:apolipoprotein D and lipocalin family protein
MRRITILFLLILLSGCSHIPDNVEPVKNFDVRRYLGTWYEIARLPNSFEKDLEKVTAHYSLRDDGGIKVVNRGFNTKSRTWKEAVGKAYFVADSGTGRLKVSFFGPFYGGYNIIDLDENYSHSLVCGPNRDYLWILARTPTIEGQIKERFIAKARYLGFDTGRLIYVEPQETER